MGTRATIGMVTLLALSGASAASSGGAAEGPTGSSPDQATGSALVIRVAGDQAPPRYERGVWRWERCAIPTALPVGYPPPTPPGAIEIKRYPEARRAQVSMTTPQGWSSSAGFMPLFGHISRNDIPMTAPVEMEFETVTDNPAQPVGWTMAFLYERPDQGELGADARDSRVQVVQTEPVTVISLGTMGYNRVDGLATLESQLEAWLDERPDWRRAGTTRWFGYNGPEMPGSIRWAEVQIPIEPVPVDAPADQTDARAD